MSEAKLPPRICDIKAWPGCRLLKEWTPCAGVSCYAIEHETAGLFMARYGYTLGLDSSSFDSKDPLRWRPAVAVQTIEYQEVV